MIKTKEEKFILYTFLDRKDLEYLIKGYGVHYDKFDDPLVKKAGFRYSEQYSRTSWDKLNELTPEELFNLCSICKNSWRE